MRTKREPNLAEGLVFTHPEYVSSAKDAHAARCAHVVMPECQVPVRIKDPTGHGVYGTEMSTGPHQAQVRHNPSMAFTWFKVCTHGPEKDERGNVIPPHLRPYFEGNVKSFPTPQISDTGEVLDWEDHPRWVVMARLKKVSVDPTNMSGEGVRYHMERGALRAAQFGYPQFCQMSNCWNLATEWFPVARGFFCSILHAKLVKAHEEGVILPIRAMLQTEENWPLKPNATARNKRMQGVAV